MEEEILHLHDRYNLRKDEWTPITVRIQRWQWWNISDFRVKLSIVEGYYETSEMIDKALSESGNNAEFPDYPKHFEIVCSLGHMLEIANALTKICQHK
jgi:hypothetical protein